MVMRAEARVCKPLPASDLQIERGSREEVEASMEKPRWWIRSVRFVCS